MRRDAQSVVLVLFGGVLMGITVSGTYTSYVKVGFAPLLIAAGAVLVVLGLVGLGQSARRLVTARKTRLGGPQAAATPHHGDHWQSHDGHSHADDGHDHDRSKAPWLLLAPVLMLVAVAPTALGSDAVARNAGSQAALGDQLPAAPAGSAAAASSAAASAERENTEGYARNDGSGTPRNAAGRREMTFAPIPAGQNPPMTFRSFVLRALYDSQDSVAKEPVTLVGFIAPPGDGFTSGYTLARLTISCCAADASPMRVHVDGDPPFPTDTWVSAVVKAVPDSGNQDNYYVPTVTIESIVATEQPSVPYET